MSFNPTHDIGIWVGAILTLCIFSFLFKDNPVYKFAEHLFVGVSAGYFLVLQYNNVFIPNLWEKLFPEGFISLFSNPQSVNLIYIFPALLGLFMLARFIPQISWLSRWSVAFLVGTTAGITIYSSVQGQVIAQMQATMLPFYVKGDPSSSINNIILVIGVIGSLLYFYFSKQHKGLIFGTGSRIGIWFLMISFGATFGYTVMARISLLIGRFQYLLGDWLGLIK